MSENITVILPSRNEAATITEVTEAIDRSLELPALAIVNADASDDESTRVAFEAASTRSPKIALRCSYRGKGHQVWEARQHVDPRSDTILVCDTDTRAPSPSVYALLRLAVSEGTDLAIANYARCWFDGGLTNHIVRPLLLCILGQDIPQPISGDLALSRRSFLAYLDAMSSLEHSPLQKCVSGYGLDTLLVYASASLGGTIKSVDVQKTKLHAPSFPHLDALFWECAPTILAPRFRGRRSSIPTQSEFEYLISEEEHCDIPAQISSLKERITGPRDPRPWHKQLLEAMRRARSDQEAIEAARWLWPRYLQRLCDFLEIGHTLGVPEATKSMVAELSGVAEQVIGPHPSSLREVK